jgi:hypothetical protein
MLIFIFASFVLGTLPACQTRTLQMDVLVVPAKNTSKLYQYYEEWKNTEHFSEYKKRLSGKGLPKKWFASSLTLVPPTFKGFSDFLSAKNYALLLKGTIKIPKSGSKSFNLPQSKSKLMVNINEISFTVAFQSGSELSVTYNGKETLMPISDEHGGSIGPFKTRNGDSVYVRFYF